MAKWVDLFECKVYAITVKNLHKIAFLANI